MTIEVTTHYPVSDPECYSDYYDVEVVVDGRLARTFGDYYHDKGYEKACAFVEALRYLNPDAKVTFRNVADREE